ncbi:unnamed protein product [Moneuplotes crassus]|uniref:FAD-binding FR-type domain-containing protein n=1 Tax=Euplotes crassus TaxID=5936 RepID=A0AAD2D9Y6_EUPCR|nr:unnamed protein product [Moneuplotes crassus]
MDQKKLGCELLADSTDEESCECEERMDYLCGSMVPGLEFEMNQENLVSSKIGERDLKAKIEEYLETGSLTKEQLILLLKQGAEDNYLFMIKEETYSKLVDSLGIPFDEPTDENEQSLVQSLRASKIVFLQSLRISSNLQESPKKSESGIMDLMNTRKILQAKSNFVHQNSIIQLSKNDSKLTDQKESSQSNLVRSTKEIEKETLRTRIEDVSNQSDLNLLERVPKITNQALKDWLITGVIGCISALCFVAFALYTHLKTNPVVFAMLGNQLMVAKGCALAIIFLCVAVLLFVSYDFLTAIRGCCGGKCLSLLDSHLLFHKVCGFLLFIYSTIHTICHCAWSVSALSKDDNFPAIKANISTFGFDHSPNVAEVVFLTIPGLTGIILQIAITLMFFTSLECIRRRHFQLFSYVHMVFFPVFIFGTIAHGAARWLNWGIPTALVPFIVPVLIYFWMIGRRVIDAIRRPFKVVKVSIVNNKTFINLNLEVPKGYKWKSGQYAFINIPAISKLEWHPFSISSSPNGEYLSFMIKKAGDWTTKLIDMFAAIKEQGFADIINEVGEHEYKREFRDYLMEVNFEDDESIRQNKKLYPRINVSRAVSAPAEMAARRKRIILIGAGSGIAPFLAFLDDQQIAAEGGRKTVGGDVSQIYKEEFRSTEKAHLILTSRDADQFSWLSPYIDRIMSSKKFSDKVHLHLYLTSTKCNSLPSFLFWRAFLKRQEMKTKHLLHSGNLIMGSNITLNVERPNFEKIIEEINVTDPGNFFCYVCASDMIVNQAKAACSLINRKGKDTYVLKYEHF